MYANLTAKPTLLNAVLQLEKHTNSMKAFNSCVQVMRASYFLCRLLGSSVRHFVPQLGPAQSSVFFFTRKAQVRGANVLSPSGFAVPALTSTAVGGACRWDPMQQEVLSRDSTALPKPDTSGGSQQHQQSRRVQPQTWDPFSSQEGWG